MNQINGNRKRIPNFSYKEEEILITLVEKYRDIVENKKTDSSNWDKKKNIWQQISKEFELLLNDGVKREAKSLRMKYDNLKKKTKQNLIAGGDKIKLDSTTKRIAALIYAGLNNSIDCDNNSIPGYNKQKNELTKNMEENITAGEITNDPLGIKDEFFEDTTISDDIDENSNSFSWTPAANPKEKSLNDKLDFLKNMPEENLDIYKRKLINIKKEFLANEEKRAQEKHEWERAEKQAKLKLLNLEIDIKTKQLDMLK